MKIYMWSRSLAALRVRVVLALKGIETDEIEVDLMEGQQHAPAFQIINPQKVIPALVLDDGHVLYQSMAIMEYLNEAYPTPSLLPETAIERARVRALSQIAVADGHPLVTPRVRSYLQDRLGHSDRDCAVWSYHFMGEALSALEGHLARDPETGLFSHGDKPTLADVCLFSQVIGYSYFGGEANEFPTVDRVYRVCLDIDAFDQARPHHQPSAE